MASYEAERLGERRARHKWLSWRDARGPSVRPIVGRSACNGAPELEHTNRIRIGELLGCFWFELPEEFAKSIYVPEVRL